MQKLSMHCANGGVSIPHMTGVSWSRDDRSIQVLIITPECCKIVLLPGRQHVLVKMQDPTSLQIAPWRCGGMPAPSICTFVVRIYPNRIFEFRPRRTGSVPPQGMADPQPSSAVNSPDFPAFLPAMLDTTLQESLLPYVLHLSKWTARHF